MRIQRKRSTLWSAGWDIGTRVSRCINTFWFLVHRIAAICASILFGTFCQILPTNWLDSIQCLSKAEESGFPWKMSSPHCKTFGRRLKGWSMVRDGVKLNLNFDLILRTGPVAEDHRVSYLTATQRSIIFIFSIDLVIAVTIHSHRNLHQGCHRDEDLHHNSLHPHRFDIKAKIPLIGANGLKPGTSWGTHVYQANRFSWFIGDVKEQPGGDGDGDANCDEDDSNDAIDAGDWWVVTEIMMKFHSALTLSALNGINRQLYNLITRLFITVSFTLLNCFYHTRLTLRVYSALPPPFLLFASMSRCKMSRIRPGLWFRCFPNKLNWGWAQFCKTKMSMWSGAWRRCSSRCWPELAAGSMEAIDGLTKLFRWENFVLVSFDFISTIWSYHQSISGKLKNPPQLVVCPDGVCGLCYEHSPSEGIAVVQLVIIVNMDV